MISLEECRKILGDAARDLSDADLEFLRQQLYGLADIALTIALDRIKQERRDKESPSPSTGQREIDSLWGKEAEDRLDAYARGEIASFPIDEVFSSLRDRLKR